MFKLSDGKNRIIYNYNIAESIITKPLQKKDFFTPTNKAVQLEDSINSKKPEDPQINTYIFDHHLLKGFEERPSKYLIEKRKNIDIVLNKIHNKRIDLLLSNAYDKSYNKIRNYDFKKNNDKNNSSNKNNKFTFSKTKTTFSCDKKYFNGLESNNNKNKAHIKNIVFIENDNEDNNIINYIKYGNKNEFTKLTQDKIKSNILNTVNHFFPKRYYKVKTSQKNIDEKINRFNVEMQKKQKIFDEYKKQYSIKYIKFEPNDKNGKTVKKKVNYESIVSPSVNVYNKNKALPLIEGEGNEENNLEDEIINGKKNKNKKYEKKVDIGLNTLTGYLSTPIILRTEKNGFDYYTKL